MQKMHLTELQRRGKAWLLQAFLRLQRLKPSQLKEFGRGFMLTGNDKTDNNVAKERITQYIRLLNRVKQTNIQTST
jgi:hypothetical protein